MIFPEWLDSKHIFVSQFPFLVKTLFHVRKQTPNVKSAHLFWIYCFLTMLMPVVADLLLVLFAKLSSTMWFLLRISAHEFKLSLLTHLLAIQSEV